MKLIKKLQFTTGCINNGTYEQHARITMWKLSSNTYKIIIKEFDMPNKLECEEFICGKKKSRIIWSNLFYKYSELEEVYKANPY